MFSSAVLKKTTFRRFASTTTEAAGKEHHEILPKGFFKAMFVLWGGIAAFVAQDRYFTRPDESGIPRLHPITRWILYYRKSEADRMKETRDLMMESRRLGEVSVFHRLESKRPVKDASYDPRMMTQKDWAYPPTAQEIHHVEGLNDIKWRKGYGEDEDSLEVLEQKKDILGAKV